MLYCILLLIMQQCHVVVTNYYSHLRGKEMLTEGLRNWRKFSIEIGCQDCIVS